MVTLRSWCRWWSVSKVSFFRFLFSNCEKIAKSTASVCNFRLLHFSRLLGSFTFGARAANLPSCHCQKPLYMTGRASRTAWSNADPAAGGHPLSRPSRSYRCLWGTSPPAESRNITQDAGRKSRPPKSLSRDRRNLPLCSLSSRD